MQEKDKKVYLEGLAFISTVFNESGALLPFLESLVKQTALPSEIILVDGGSRDDTLEVIRDFFKGLEKTPGFRTITVVDTGRDNSLPEASLPEAGEAVGGGPVATGRLVFESIINGFTKVKIFSAPGANISTGRNIAIKNADSEFICASDAGCRMSWDWVEEISKYFVGAEAGNAAYGSSVEIGPDDSSSQTSSFHCSGSPVADTADSANSPNGPFGPVDGCTERECGTCISGNSGAKLDIVAGGYNFPYIENFLQACLAVCVLPIKSEITGAKYMPSSRNIGFAKAAWEKAKGYPQNMDFGEDMRFNFNLKALGCRVMFNPDALVYWNLRSSLSAIFRQFFRYAKGDAIGRMYTHRHLIRFASVLLFALLILAGALISPWFLPAIIVLFAAFIYRPYFRIKYFLNDKNCCIFAENKKTLLTVKLKTIFCIPLMLPFIETAKLAGYVYGLFIRKNN